MNKTLRDILIAILPYIGLIVFFSPIIIGNIFSWWFLFLFAISWKPTFWITKYRFKLKMERKREKKVEKIPISYSHIS